MMIMNIMVMNYSPSIADMGAMRDGELLMELPEPYGPYYARMSAGATWDEVAEVCPIWEKGGGWWNEHGTGNVLSATELRTTRKHLYPVLSDKLLTQYLKEEEA